MTDVVVRPFEAVAVGSDTASRIAVAPGGSATNQAVWLARAGAEVHLVAAVGDDELGSAAQRTLDGSGVCTHLQRVAGRPTGTVVSLVDQQGQRSMLTERGANQSLTSAALPLELFGSGAHLHLSGYELLDDATRDVGIEVLALARRHEMTCSVDPCSSGPLARVGAPAFLAWTSGIDLFCGNLDEGRVLTGASDPSDVASSLLEHFAGVVLSLGAAGALWASRRGDSTRLAASPAAVVDTTGAGDALAGTFLAGWLAGISVPLALRRGLDAAAGVMSELGARGWASPVHP
jgi:sugar/nucleoside kinase (ribokinase family)